MDILFQGSVLILEKKEYDYIIKQMTIIVAEDSIEYQKMIKSVLSNFCDNIIIMDNGEEAYNAYKKYNPQVILTDIEMPKLDGLSLTEKIREKDNQTAIIILTSFINEDYLLKAANLNIQGYLKKAFEIQALKDILIKVAKQLADTNSLKINITDKLLYDKLAGILIEKNKKEIKLNKKEKALLELLLENNNRITTYQEIENKIWIQNDEVMTASALRTVVTHLRKKSTTDFIQNISGHGYKLKSS